MAQLTKIIMSMAKRNAKMAAKCQSVTEIIRTKALNKNKKLKTNGDWQTIPKINSQK